MIYGRPQTTLGFFSNTQKIQKFNSKTTGHRLTKLLSIISIKRSIKWDWNEIKILNFLADTGG